MPKNIVVLSDGTGQEGGKGHDTNVYKLFRMLEDRTERQIVFYDEGIGTDWRKITGNIAGAGFTENILQCYRFIYENYNAGDKIFLFGFSRGAATVRSLASFIHYFGILPKSRPELVKKAYGIYKVGRVKGSENQEKQVVEEIPEEQAAQNLAAQGMQSLKDFRDAIIQGASLNEKAEKFNHEHPNQWAAIEFLGVWDTVPALGMPGAIIDTFVNLLPSWKHRYHDFTLHPSVKNAYHALSIDDDRKWFHPTIWEAYNRDFQKVEQVWFSGAHTDVGGGFRDPGLSDIVLEWMIQKAVPHGLKLYLKSRKYWNFCIAPDPTDEIHPPRTGTGSIYPAKQRHWDGRVLETFGPPTIHESVLKRVEYVDGYKPWILEEFPNHKTEPWEDTFEYEGKKISIRDYDEKNWEKIFILDSEEPKLVTDSKKLNQVTKEHIQNRLLQRGEWSDKRLKRDLTRWKKKKSVTPPAK